MFAEYAFKLLWHLSHHIFNLLLCIYSVYVSIKTKLNELKHSYSGTASIADIYQHLEKLESIPKHLTILLGGEQPSFKDLSNLIVWSVISGVSFISIYDMEGKVKKNEGKLQFELKKVLPHNHNVIWHNEDKTHKNGYSGKKIHVKLLSYEDGHKTLANSCKVLKSSDLSIEVLDEHLRQHYEFPDPQLGIYCGNYLNLYGYPPWQIRLTEFLNLQTHHNVPYLSFINVLQRYNKCEQRVGK